MKPGELDQFTNAEYQQSLSEIKNSRNSAQGQIPANEGLWIALFGLLSALVTILLKPIYLILSELRENHL